MIYFPRIWWRYVDDVFAIFSKKQDLNHFVNQINSFYPTIKFTYEEEHNNSLPFLDLLIIKNNNSGNIEFDIYRKPSQSFRYITNDSCHPPCQKRAAFQSMIHRLLNTPLSTYNYSKEVSKIKEIASFNGFSETLIECMINKKYPRRSNLRLANFHNFLVD